MTKTEIMKRCFDAYRLSQRELLEGIFTDDFTFTSPYDDRIDKKTYFERCWPGNQHITGHVIEEIIESGDHVYVHYKCTTTDGREFRNVEIHTFDGDKIKKVEVYFGAAYQDSGFLTQHEMNK